MNQKTVEILRKVQEVIRATPDTFYMGEWIDFPSRASCRGCIAFHSLYTLYKLRGFKEPLMTLEEFGKDLEKELSSGPFLHKLREKLYLDEDETVRLLYISRWPEEFRVSRDVSQEEYVENACKRIDFFILTDGTDKIKSQDEIKVLLADRLEEEEKENRLNSERWS